MINASERSTSRSLWSLPEQQLRGRECVQSRDLYVGYDTIAGSPPAASDPSGDWRADVARWAHAKCAMLCARPWLAALPFVAAPQGPNWLSWVEAVIAPLSGIGLSAIDTGEMLSVIDGDTRGASDTPISLAAACARWNRAPCRVSEGTHCGIQARCEVSTPLATLSVGHHVASRWLRSGGVAVT